jgi:hypothetical protein
VPPHAAAAFMIVAAGGTIGSVMGRYHYTVDALADLLVGVFACVLAPALPAAAQSAPHVEVAATLADTNTHPIYYKPIVPLTTDPSAPVLVGRIFDVATPGIDVAVYVGSRVQGIVRRSNTPGRTSDPPPLPLPPASGFGYQLVIKATEHRTRSTVAAAVDVLSRQRVRVAVGGGLHVDHVTGDQVNRVMITNFHGVVVGTTTRDFEPVTMKAPVLLSRIKIYPWNRLLMFADVSVRLGSEHGDRAMYQSARVTPGFGLGISL